MVQGQPYDAPIVSALHVPPLALLGSLPTASAIFDQDVCYVAVNERWREVYGLADTPLEGRSHYEVFPEIGEEWKAVHRRCLAGATERRRADPFPRAAGRMDYIDWTVAPWHRPDGGVGGIVMHTEVVTEREVWRRRLGDERAFSEGLFGHASIGMNLCRLDGRWLDSNLAFLDIIGYDEEEAKSLTYWELTPREYDDAEQEQLRSLETTGRYGPYEKDFVRKDGTRVPVRLHGFTFERGGETFIWSLIEDITKQRALEQELERERLTAMHAAKLASLGEMAAGIAHELNNPLQIIEGYAFELQMAREDGEVPSEEALAGIRLATDRAARIVQGLRRFARREQPEIGLLSAALVVEESLAFTAGRIRNEGITLEVDVRSEREVRGNGLELTQVLVNLLNNAAEAVREMRGTVRLVVEDDDDAVCFRVFDDGPGVDASMRERLFEPFVTSKADGTGLGLSISRSIVAAMGGSLEYARLDEESEFTVRVPAGGAP